MKLTRLMALTFAAVLLAVCGSSSCLIAQETESTTRPDKSATPKVDQEGDPKTDKEDEKKVAPIIVEVSDGNIRFSASGTWVTVAPRNRIIEKEMKIKRSKGDKADGRLTIMGAGGTIEANIDRWKKQFSVGSGKDGEKKADVKKLRINGQQVTMFDMTGTFMDAPGGPFSGQPKVERPNYRMLVGIVQTEKDGNYFVKLYGPKKTIDDNEKRFKEMIQSVNVAE